MLSNDNRDVLFFIIYISISNLISYTLFLYKYLYINGIIHF